MHKNLYLYRSIKVYSFAENLPKETQQLKVHTKHFEKISETRTHIINTKHAEIKQELAQHVCTEFTGSKLSCDRIHTSTQMQTQQTSNYKRGGTILALAHSDLYTYIIIKNFIIINVESVTSTCVFEVHY